MRKKYEQWDKPNQIITYDLIGRQFKTIVAAEETVGDVMPLGNRFAVGFFNYPKLFDIQTGKVIHRWENLKSGSCLGSLGIFDKHPALAFDAGKGRFALADDTEITVIEIL